MIATSPTPAIAAMVMRARRKIAAHFFVHHAVSAEDAVAYIPQGLVMRRQFERMQHRGVIRSGAGGYWLDTAAYQAELDRRRRILVPVVIALAVVAAVALMLAGYRG